MDVFETSLASNLVIQYILLINTAPWPWLISAGCCVCQAVRREVKGLSDGNVLLQTGHGAGMQSALQPFSCASGSCIQQIHTNTHTCVCMHPGDKASFLCTAKPRVLCLPGKDWNGNGHPDFASSHHNKTHSTKSREDPWQRQSPRTRTALQTSILSPALCSSHCQLHSGVHSKTFTWPNAPKHTSGNSDWGNDFYEASRQKKTTNCHCISVFKNTLCNQGE